MMTMTEEKQTANSVAFVVEMPDSGATLSEKELLVKQRLEAESASFDPTTSLEEINAKLEKAEVKRKMSLSHINSEEKR